MSDVEIAEYKELGFEITELEHDNYCFEYKQGNDVIIGQASKERISIEIITSLLTIVKYHSEKRAKERQS